MCFPSCSISYCYPLPRNWNPIDHRISICTKLNLYILMYHKSFAHFRDFVSEIIPFTTLPVTICESSISSNKIFWIFTKFAYLQIMRILFFVVLYIAIARLATILRVVGIKIQQHKFGGWHIQNTIRSKALGVFYRNYDTNSWRRIVFMFLDYVVIYEIVFN